MVFLHLLVHPSLFNPSGVHRRTLYITLNHLYTPGLCIIGLSSVMLFQLQNSPFAPALLDRLLSTIMALLPPPSEAVTGKVIHGGYRNLPPDELVDLAIESHIARIVKRSLVGGDESFFIADLGQIIRQHRRWTQSMPGIRPYYGITLPFYYVSCSRNRKSNPFHFAAVKCNRDPTFLKVLAELETGFDCASIEEMRAVLSLGVDPARILFANPCKAPAAVAFAREVGVLRTTFDNIDELDAIKIHMPEAQLLLRIYANDEGAFICLGEKFGAQLDTTEELLSRAWELGLNMIGVSFHVGKHLQYFDVIPGQIY